MTKSNENKLIEILANENIETLIVRGRKGELEKYCEQLGLSKVGSSKTLANQLLTWYDSKTYQERLIPYEQLPLTISMKPSRFHRKTVRDSIGVLWKKVRLEVLLRDNATCSVCGYKPNETELKNLQVHEEEVYYRDKSICELIGIKLVCSYCHDFYHIGRLYTSKYITDELREIRIEHFLKVNNLSRSQYAEYLRLFKLRNRFENDVYNLERIKNISSIPLEPTTKVRFKVGPNIPLRNDVIRKLKEKDLYVNF